MPYTKQQWHDDTTTAPYGPINGTRLNYIETGIETAQATAEAAGGGGGAGIGTALPLIDGTASAGVGTVSSAVDHVHPTDTSRAPLASPTFTGSPVLPTGTTATTQSAADSTTKLATTAFVTTADNLKANLASPTFTGTVVLPTGTVTSGMILDGTIVDADISASGALSVSKLAPGTAAQVLTTTAGTAVWATPSAGGGASIGTALPLINGVAALAGTAATASAVDHVHPTDTTRAALASPTFTGSPVLPTGTTGVTQTAADNSTKLATTAYVDAKERAFMFGKAGAIGATETNAADVPFIVPFAATMKRCKVVLGSAASGAMTVQIRKASAPGTAVPSYSDVTGFVATFANGSQVATFTLGTAVTAAEGDLLNFSAATGSGFNLAVQVVAT